MLGLLRVMKRYEIQYPLINRITIWEKSIVKKLDGKEGIGVRLPKEKAGG